MQRYNGTENYKEITDFATSLVQTNIIELGLENYFDFINDNQEIYKVVLFTKAKSIPITYKTLSVEYKTRLVFGLAGKE